MRLSLIAAMAVTLGTLPALADSYERAGAELRTGEPAIVPHLVPKGPEVPIELRVTAIEEGSADDLKGFEIPKSLAKARPIYVRYEYKNLSDEDLSAQQVGAFVAIDDRDQAHAPALAMSAGSFTKCTTPPAKGLTKGQSGRGCLLFMIHESGRLKAAAYKGHYRSEGGGTMQAKYPIYYNPVRWVAAEAASAPTGPRRVIVQ
ncbi:hypothetical protein ABZT49_22505 [Methylobacterium sp. EM32]|uniref:hypothetical protein n=1 Tax=Methylobacterium sp. EM32 TaxID=3163481 RepID=UPI0033A6042A